MSGYNRTYDAEVKEKFPRGFDRGLRSSFVSDRDTQSAYDVTVVPIESLNEKQIAEWEELESSALEPNAFLSPGFVIPSLRYFERRAKTLVMMVYDKVTVEPVLRGLAVVEERMPSLRFPFPHLWAYKSPHSYLTGILLDRQRPSEALEALIGFLLKNRFRWYGIGFCDLPWEGSVGQALRTLENRGAIAWYGYWISRRASLDIGPLLQRGAVAHMSRKQRQNIRRSRRGLEQLGEVHWRYLRGAQVGEDTIDTFLRLEHSGWKGKQGTSLQAKKEDERFFREMIGNFLNRDRAFFTELCINGEVVASTCNLLSGTSALAWKVGWKQELARYSPGTLNEVEFLENARRFEGEMTDIDSGSTAGSYIDKLWPDRKSLACGVFITNRAVMPVIRLLHHARKLKHRFRHMKDEPSSEAVA